MRLFAFFAFLFSFSSTLEYGRIFSSRGRGKKSERRRRGIRKRLDDGNARTDRMLIFIRFLSFVLSVCLSATPVPPVRSIRSLPFPSHPQAPPSAPSTPAGQVSQVRPGRQPSQEAKRNKLAKQQGARSGSGANGQPPCQSNPIDGRLTEPVRPTYSVDLREIPYTLQSTTGYLVYFY